MYDKVLTNRNVVEHEKAVEQFWKDNDIFKKSMENRKEGETYTFYDGPPTANGKPHIGHVLTRVIKDMIPRYQTMKGKMVPRKAGWDTHGLPVELGADRGVRRGAVYPALQGERLEIQGNVGGFFCDRRILGGHG